VDENTTILKGSLNAQLGWLAVRDNVTSNVTYILEINSDQTISPHVFSNHSSGSTSSGTRNITIRLRGIGGNRTIKLSSNGNMFTVPRSNTLILENNITLHGHNGNSGSIVYIDGDARVGYGIGARFEMAGGTITGNITESHGGAVYVRNGTFIMQGGTISGNSAIRGGGVYMFEGASGVTANFDMRGGTITGNTAAVQGGGLWIANSDFVSVEKTDGTITGYDTDPETGNAVMSGSTAQTGMGHAIYRGADQRRETTVGPAVDLRHDREDGWDD
jgi:hypothetical protein